MDGYGNQLLMDDANAPGLVSLAYLGICPMSDAVYQRTRAFALSDANPYFFRGTAAEGMGGPHIGLNSIWPMSIMYRAFTSTSDAEIRQCLRWLRDTTAGTGFMHESFNKDNPAKFTRSWFAWANTLFGELMLTLAEEAAGACSAAAAGLKTGLRTHGGPPPRARDPLNGVEFLAQVVGSPLQRIACS